MCVCVWTSPWILAVLISSARKTVSRSLVLVVSMGYGVVRPTLGGLTKKVVSLSAAYFVATATLDVMTNVGAIDDLTSSARIFLAGAARQKLNSSTRSTGRGRGVMKGVWFRNRQTD